MSKDKSKFWAFESFSRKRCYLHSHVVTVVRVSIVMQTRTRRESTVLTSLSRRIQASSTITNCSARCRS